MEPWVWGVIATLFGSCATLIGVIWRNIDSRISTISAQREAAQEDRARQREKDLERFHQLEKATSSCLTRDDLKDIREDIQRTAERFEKSLHDGLMRLESQMAAQHPKRRAFESEDR